MCPTSSAIRETQINTTFRFPRTLARIAIIRSRNETMLLWMCGKGKILCKLVDV